MGLRSYQKSSSECIDVFRFVPSDIANHNRILCYPQLKPILEIVAMVLPRALINLNRNRLFLSLQLLSPPSSPTQGSWCDFIICLESMA